MDFLDPEKKRAHKIRLLIGYALITVLILMSAVVLLYQASGYGFGKNGQIIQNGLVFVNSSPNGADIYLNNTFSGSKTNNRLVLQAGQYTLSLKRNGYRTWVRSLGVEGGSVERFSYPFLFPSNLATKTIQSYAGVPGMSAQSPDRRWLLMQQVGSDSSFDMYDLNNHSPAPITVTVPVQLLTSPAGAQSWQFVEWAGDNRRVLLLHQYQGGDEYILLDRQSPASSLNLTKTLSLAPTAQLSLSNHRYDHYFVYDQSSHNLTTATLNNTAQVPLLSQVLAFKTYSDNAVLYATDAAALPGKVNIRLLMGDNTYQLRVVAAGGSYLLSLSNYGNSLFVVLGASVEDKVYVYQDPIASLSKPSVGPLVPLTILKVTTPNFAGFSPDSRFVVVESGQAFAVYDAANDKTYSYQVTIPFDASSHATWMDGAHLLLISGGKTVVFDYDDANQQTLNAALPATTPYFDTKYQYMYVLAPTTKDGQTILTNTALTFPAQ